MSKDIIHQTAEQKAVVDELEALRCALGIGVRELAKNYTSYSHDVYRRMRTDTYAVSKASVVANVIDDYAAAIRALRSKFANQLRAMESGTSGRGRLPVKRSARFVETETIAAAVTTFEEAVERAADPKFYKRVIQIMGPTRSGKTEIIAHICERFGCYYANGTPLWKTSITAGMAGIVYAMDTHASWSTRWQLERTMFELLSRPVKNPITGKDEPCVLHLDTFNLAGPLMWGVVLSIIDNTPAVVCLAGTTAMIDRACLRSFDISSQVMGRTLQTYILPPLLVRDVVPLLEGIGLNGEAEDAARLLVKAANLFGRWELVTSVRESLLLERGAHRSLAMVRRALAVETQKIEAAMVTERLRSMDAEKRKTARDTTLALHETTGAKLALEN